MGGELFVYMLLGNRSIYNAGTSTVSVAPLLQARSCEAFFGVIYVIIYIWRLETTIFSVRPFCKLKCSGWGMYLDNYSLYGFFVSCHVYCKHFVSILPPSLINIPSIYISHVEMYLSQIKVSSYLLASFRSLTIVYGFIILFTP